jgi:hypothetical protein
MKRIVRGTDSDDDDANAALLSKRRWHHFQHIGVCNVPIEARYCFLIYDQYTLEFWIQRGRPASFRRPV